MSTEFIKQVLGADRILEVRGRRGVDSYRMDGDTLYTQLQNAPDGSERWSPAPDKDAVIDHIGNQRGYYKDAKFSARDRL